MNIVGVDALVFGVEDYEACARCLLDYGLQRVADDRFEAMDGTSIILRSADDPTLPKSLGTRAKLRETVYGVADDDTLRGIAAELGKDREVRRAADGSVQAFDDMGFALRFQKTVRRPFSAEPELVNSPGSPPQRGVNLLGIDAQNPPKILPRTLSHVVYFVPDFAKAEAFYVERLGFRCTDRFMGLGPFLRPAGSLEHHTLFLIQTPAHMKGIEHFTFHMGGPTEVLYAGTQFGKKGYETFWGPGRHLLGSNWFWYFNSPFGCHIEYDADMDLHDDSWEARAVPMGADGSQLFLFTAREKWAPGPPPGAKP